MADVTSTTTATGKRKSSIARVRLMPGTGQITVNGRDMDEYFPRPALQILVRKPMELTESLVEGLATALVGSTTLPYGDERIDVARPWRRATMRDLVGEATGADFGALQAAGDIAGARAALAAAGVPEALCAKGGSVGELLNVGFEELCEDTLRQPTFVVDYPVEVSPLAKPHEAIGDPSDSTPQRT